MITLAYSELIGKFNKIRDYMREFYIYGFKSRNEIDHKSLRTYDDERRRIESWLGDYMSFTQSASGKAQFISVDSREVIHNPLYKAFKTSTFSQYDILLHFCLLDFMTEEEWLTLVEIIDRLQSNYFNRMGNNFMLEERTVRNKLNSYADLGILQRRKGRRNQDFYALVGSNIDLATWKDAIEFYSETNPIGVIGSFLLDKKELGKKESSFWYKHHYMLYAIDSEILETLLEGISCKKYVEITTLGKKKSQNKKEVYPIKIYVSTQNGREYLACHETGCSGLSFIRLDNIKTARLKKCCEANQQYENEYVINKQYLWGVITGNAKDILHIEITIYVGENDEFILHRLEREKRNGHIYKVNDVNYKYVVDTYDAMELMPWIRTFIGRVVKIESSNPELEKKFKEDMSILYSMYLGGDDDVVQ